MTDAEGNEIGKLFVGGISQNTSNMSLRLYFSQFGELEDAVVMMDNKTGRSRGFGYVKYRDPECVKLVLGSKPHWLDGKEIDAKQCNVNMKGRNRRSLKIFVGGIGLDQDVNSITAFFEKFGHVTDVNLMMDPSKQRHRGFAFIGFDDELVVSRLINMHFLTMGSKQVEIKAMEPPNFSRKTSTPLTRHSNELSELKEAALRDAVNSHMNSTKTPSKMCPQQNFSGLQYQMGLDGSPYGITPCQQHQGLMNTFNGDMGGRLIGDQFGTGMYPIPGKINPMPVIFTNGFLPMYPGCQTYPYPIIHPQVMHPGILPGNEELWTHNICPPPPPQQQPMMPPSRQGNSRQSDASDCDQRVKEDPSQTACLNVFDQGLGMWCMNPVRCHKPCLEQHSVINTPQTNADLSEPDNQQSPVLAKPSGDNFDREEAGGLNMVKEEAATTNPVEVSKESTGIPPSANWVFQRPQQIPPSSGWNFRPNQPTTPFWGDMPIPLQPGYFFHPPTAPTGFEPIGMENFGGYGYPIIPERQPYREDCFVGEHGSAFPLAFPACSNNRPRRRDSQERVGMRWASNQQASASSSTETGTKKAPTTSTSASSTAKNEAAVAGSSSPSSEKPSIAGDHSSGAFRTFRV